MRKRVYTNQNKTLMYHRCELLKKRLKLKDKEGILEKENDMRKFMQMPPVNSFEEYLEYLYDKLDKTEKIDTFDPHETLCRRYREHRLIPMMDRLVRVEKIPSEKLDRIPEFVNLFNEINAILGVENARI